MGQLYFEKFQHKGFDCFIERRSRENPICGTHWMVGLILREDHPFIELAANLGLAIGNVALESRDSDFLYFMDNLDNYKIDMGGNFDRNYKRVLEAYQLKSAEIILRSIGFKFTEPDQPMLAPAVFKACLHKFIDRFLIVDQGKLFSDLACKSIALCKEDRFLDSGLLYITERLLRERDEARQYTETLQHRIVELQRRLNSER